MADSYSPRSRLSRRSCCHCRSFSSSVGSKSRRAAVLASGGRILTPCSLASFSLMSSGVINNQLRTHLIHLCYIVPTCVRRVATYEKATCQWQALGMSFMWCLKHWLRYFSAVLLLYAKIYFSRRQPLACHPILVVLLLFTLWQMHLASFDARRSPISNQSGLFLQLALTYALFMILSILVSEGSSPIFQRLSLNHRAFIQRFPSQLVRNDRRGTRCRRLRVGTCCVLGRELYLAGTFNSR